MYTVRNVIYALFEHMIVDLCVYAIIHKHKCLMIYVNNVLQPKTF